MKEKLLFGLKWFFNSFIWLGLVLLGLDIFTKQLVMSLSHNTVGVIADWGFVHISYVLNEGAAFGMGTGNPTANRIIYLVVATLISIGLMCYLIIKRKTMTKFIRATLIMVIVGAFGNMIDRIFYGPLQGESGLFTGRVVDWIDFYWFWGYVFNIADCCIVIAAFMLIVYIIVQEVKDYRAKNKTVVKQADAPKKILSKTERELEEAKTKKDEPSE
ncbi:MAG: signal peptidase II [Bacilli bacterium]|nr:signal peptidase II [Bacilli bacterium]